MQPASWAHVRAHGVHGTAKRVRSSGRYQSIRSIRRSFYTKLHATDAPIKGSSEEAGGIVRF
jgi:hypothetical protein